MHAAYSVSMAIGRRVKLPVGVWIMLSVALAVVAALVILLI